MKEYAQTYSFSESIITCVWIIWVLVIGFIESLMQFVFPHLHIIIEEDEWKVRIVLR